jgi:hypothetical protein
VLLCGLGSLLRLEPFASVRSPLASPVFATEFARVSHFELHCCCSLSRLSVGCAIARVSTSPRCMECPLSGTFHGLSAGDSVRQPGGYTSVTDLPFLSKSMSLSSQACALVSSVVVPPSSCACEEHPSWGASWGHSKSLQLEPLEAEVTPSHSGEDDSLECECSERFLGFCWCCELCRSKVAGDSVGKILCDAVCAVAGTPAFLVCWRILMLRLQSPPCYKASVLKAFFTHNDSVAFVPWYWAVGGCGGFGVSLQLHSELRS